MFVKPREGYLIRDPLNPRSILPPGGAHVPETMEWHRRLIQGDVELATPPAPDAPASKE